MKQIKSRYNVGDMGKIKLHYDTGIAGCNGRDIMVEFRVNSVTYVPSGDFCRYDLETVDGAIITRDDDKMFTLMELNKWIKLS